MGFGDKVAAVLDIIRKEKREYKDYLPNEAIYAGEDLSNNVVELWSGVKKKIVELIKSEIPYEYPHVSVWWYSVLIGMDKDPILFQEFMKYVKENKVTFSANTQFFLYYQFISLMFRYPELNIAEMKREIWKFRMEIVEEFSKKIEASLEPIALSDRNADLIIVITDQFLEVEHGPTKTALDRCRALINKMGKNVVLINTGDMLSIVGAIPFYDSRGGSYVDRKLYEKEQYWKGVKIPYYQCEHNMPNVEKMNQLLKDIRKLAPKYVVAIGGGGILADLVSKMIPTLTNGLAPSDLEYTCAKYQTLSRKLNEEDVRTLQSVGFTENNIIESIFTSSLKPQTEHITRKELGVLEDKFLMVVVGARLDSEVTDKFLNMLDRVLDEDMLIGFFGKFNGYEKRICKFPKLRERSVYFGFCKDILSRLEVCDLYLNPVRVGGGTSCVEALFMGLPVITVDYGDVAVNAGEDFCVKDYEEMQEKILLYYRDKNYYKDMSEKAMNRAKILLDTETEFIRIMQEMERRESEN